MSDYTNREVAMFLGYNAVLITMVGVIAYTVTPWAMMGLFFVGSSYERVTVEHGEYRVSAATSDVTEEQIVRMLYEVQEVDDRDRRESADSLRH